MPTRRRFLATAGTTLALAGDWLRPAQGQPAAAPAAVHADQRVRFAAAAIRAPNPHNRQPWLLRLDADGGATLFCDLERRLPETDPFDRQITIGLGAFAELYRLAAAEQGVAIDIVAFPAGESSPRLDSRPVARLVASTRPVAADPLSAAAPQRRSVKQPYDMTRPPDAAMLATLRAALLEPARFGASVEPHQVATLRDLSWQALVTEARTSRTHMESVNLMRLGRAAMAANPDGIGIGGPQVEEMVARGTLSQAAFAQTDGPAFTMMLDLQRRTVEQTPAFVWLTSEGDSRAQHLAAGRDWLRLNLAATLLGLGLHPWSQALQEYPEMASAYAATHAAIGTAPGQRLQMLGRLGMPVGDSVRQAPRWPVESRILPG